MLFNKFLAVSALSTLAVATPVDLNTRTDGSNCNTGPIQCCETVTTALDPVVGPVLKVLGIVIQDLNIPVALTCSPITILGGGNGGCNAHPVCCENNSYGGLISIGCIAIIL
ncbi:hypothetical protein PQX77_017630 [Marasmius sp. AFHP31]|nr:hypothetical protein PQX77_017630 [Marasmius sp. AFHP31]